MSDYFTCYVVGLICGILIGLFVFSDLSAANESNYAVYENQKQWRSADD